MIRPQSSQSIELRRSTAQVTKFQPRLVEWFVNVKPNLALKTAVVAATLVTMAAPQEAAAYGLNSNTGLANPSTVPGVGGNPISGIGSCQLQFVETEYPGQSSFPFAPRQARELQINIGTGFQMFVESNQVTRANILNKNITAEGVRVSNPATIESECGVTNVEITRTFFDHSNPAGSWARRFNNGQSMGMEIRFDEPTNVLRQRIVAQYISPEFSAGQDPTGRTQISKIGINAPNGPLPAATITTAEVTTLDPFDFRVEWTTPVADFTLSDVVLTGPATVTSISGSGRGPYLVTVTPTGNGVVTLNVPAGVATDSEGRTSRASLTPATTVNAPLNAAPTLLFSDDIEAGPVASDQFVVTASDTDVGDTLTVQYTFSDDGICDATDVGFTTIANGATVPVTAANNGDYVCASVNDGTVTTYQISENPINIDVINPTPIISADSGTPTEITTLDPFTVTVTFDENVNDFDDLPDVTVANGSVTNIRQANGNTFVVTIEPTSTTESVSITVPQSVATDEVGNENLESNTFVITNLIDDTVIEVVEEILEDDLFTTTALISQSASNISRRASDRLQFDRGQACVVQINTLLSTTPVRFASDSFVIDASNKQLLDDIAGELSKCETARFMIAGHTDSDASNAYNATLSQNRVDAVKTALLRRGIASERLQTRGFGESRPIASNATEEGQALNRRVEFVLLDGVEAVEPACGSGQPLGGSFDAGANDSGLNLNGAFGSGGYNCVTGEHTETWGAVDIVSDDEVGTQGMASFGISKERQVDNTLRGRFVEGYVSRKDVDTADADGTITGVGVHGGVFGARALESGLVTNYYASAAIGRHAFDLNVGSDVDGSYSYAGIFAGAAVTGEQAVGNFSFKPRAGVDLAYSQTIGAEISNAGTLEIEPATYARGFIELGLLRKTGSAQDGASGYIGLAPRAFCEATDDTSEESCGYGARFDFASATSTTGTQWNAEFDYEAIGDREQSSLAVSRTQSVMSGMGVSRSSLGASASGVLSLGQALEFSW